jgi:hypothetical protein
MYGLIAAQMAVLGWVVVYQEVNRALDGSVPVDLEIPHAYAQKDPFRGAYVHGEPAVSLGGPDAQLPAERLAPGDRVLVFFATDPGKRPGLVRVERRGWGSGPGFTAAGFTVPGTVTGPEAQGFRIARGRGLIASVGHPTVLIELDFPRSIAIEDRALDQLTSPSFVRVGLRQGFLGHRYLTNVRLAGVSFSYQTSFALDEARDRLVVVAPREPDYLRRRFPAEQQPRTEFFVFDGSGKETGSAEVTARLLGAVMHPSDGTLWTLLGEAHYGATVQLAELRADGTVVRRGQPVQFERILGFDEEEGSLWVLAGTPLSAPRAPFAVERLTFDGPRGPRLGPFPSRPRAVISRGRQVWVLEADQHRVKRLDRAGQVEREYRDTNNPTEIIPGPDSLFVIEASRTQLTRFSAEGQAVWRVPKFQGLAWVLADPTGGDGWAAAQGFEGREGGVFRFDAEGKVSRLPLSVTPRTADDWSQHKLGRDVARSGATGRIYFRDPTGLVILEPDGTLVRRVEGFRFATERPLRG